MVIFTKRKLRTEIVVAFLFLIAAASAIIITYTYEKNSRSIEKFSQGTIDRVGALILERTECMLRGLQRLPEVGAGIFLRHPGISVENKELIAFFLDEVKYHNNIYSYYTGEPSGSALIVFNLALADQPFYFSEKAIPQEAVFAMLIREPSAEGGKEHWFYLDKGLKVLETKDYPSSKYDPRVRPWYKGAVQSGKLYWTGVFEYEHTKDLGIAVSNPVYNEKGELVSVIAADLSLQLFSKFLAEQSIGKAGKAFVLNTQGKIVIPLYKEADQEQEKTVAKMFSHYSKFQTADFIFSDEGRKFLVSFRKFPEEMGKDWVLAVVAPLSDYFAELIQTQREVVLISIIVLIIAALLVIYFSKHISDPIVTLSQEVDKISRLDLESETRVSSPVEEISRMDASIAAMRTAFRSFSRYVPKCVVKQLLEKGKHLVLGGEKKVLTTLFTDITEFTPIAEAHPIETVTELLAEYFGIVTKTVLQEKGTIDKFIGDSVMAFWGAPNDDSSQAAHACTAVLKCQARLKEMNRRRKEKNIPEFHSRMGLQIGLVNVGNFGTDDRMNYTALGDPVNTAFRLEQISKVYRTTILVSDEVLDHAGPFFLARFLDIVEVKGKKKKIKIFELLGALQGDPEILATPQQIESCAAFTKAAEAYHQGDFQAAKTLFLAFSKQYPDDYPTLIYIARLKEKQ